MYIPSSLKYRFHRNALCCMIIIMLNNTIIIIVILYIYEYLYKNEIHV